MRTLARALVSIGMMTPGVQAAAGELAVQAVAAGRAITVESRQAWIDGGFGRLSVGAASDTF
jgi:hypothetical protein